MDDLSQVGVAAIVTILLLRETFSLLKTKTNGNGDTKQYVFESSKMMGSLEVELRRLSHAINNLSQLTSTLHHEVKETRATVKEVRDEMKK